MKLLMSTDTIGGVWTYAIDLAAALSREGFEIVLACTGNRLSPDQWRQVQELSNTTVLQRQCKLEWMDDPWEDVHETGQWLLSLRDRFQVDIVHLNELVHGDLPWQVPTLLVGHSCVASWWQAVKQGAVPRHFERYMTRVQASLSKVDVIVAPSQAMAASLKQYYHPPKPVQVIANGRSDRFMRTGAKHPMILSVGRLWDEAKNLSLLDEAAANLRWPVYLAGSTTGPGRSAQASASHARLLGPLPSRSVLTWMGRADIYALPARYEPFGLSVLEAAMSGCCLVLGDIPSLRENWDGAAAFVNPDDSHELHATLHQLICNPSRRRALAEASRLRSNTFSLQHMAGSYVQHYQQMHCASTAAAT